MLIFFFLESFFVFFVFRVITIREVSTFKLGRRFKNTENNIKKIAIQTISK